MPDLARRSVRVDVPASTANLGAGFDVLALALDISNEVEVEAVDGRPGWVDLSVEGAGAGQLGRRNRFVQALAAGLDAAGAGGVGVGWRIRMRNGIPLSRGLGSSAAATVAGLVAADALLGGGRLDTEAILEIAARMEGHPDNAAAALLGGFVVVATVDGRPHAVRFDPPPRLSAVIFIPERPLSTAAMRAALPATVPFDDAVHNVGASSLAVAAMASGQLWLLRAATEDRLHEQYRAMAYRELPRLTDAAREAGALGACLSGAGSTVIAFVDDERMARDVEDAFRRAGEAAGLPGDARTVRPRGTGARVLGE